MSTSNAIENLVERFVQDLVGFLHEEEGDRRAVALAIVESLLTKLPQPKSAPRPAARKPDRPAAIWSRQHRLQSTAPAKAAETTTSSAEESPAPTFRPRIRHPRMIVVPTGQSSATYKPPSPVVQTSSTTTMESAVEPASQRRPVQGAAEREALMLESVRTLVRATAGEIAQHGGLPSGTAYVVLKQLITNGRVAKTETARGVEYSLVSTGAIRPFKRTRGGAVAEPQEAPAAGEA
ncbi:MAG: hypothetical protein ABJE95_06420 [Byssovorax sp.]